jgi:mRNA-degrading endonuclease HigB of HigAB toxin-antitoxin module
MFPNTGTWGCDGLWRSGHCEVRQTIRFGPETIGAVSRNRQAGRMAAPRDTKQSFPATDYAAATGTLIFDIGGNKYRLIARVDFEEQVLFIQRILTHEEYERENF